MRARSADLAGRVAAEAYAAGATGLEERGDARSDRTLLVYVPAEGALAVERAMAALADEGVEVEAPEPVPEIDWSTQWRAGLEPIRISPRLVVSPSFAPQRARAGSETVVIDPGQAFGTGSHVSTRLALELLDQVAPRLPRPARILDVGTGTGVLAIAALRLGATSGVAFDLDPVATASARANAQQNQVSGCMRLFTGGLDALTTTEFDLVVVNLLRTELSPLIPAIAQRTRRGGLAIFAGLLEPEQRPVETALQAAGLWPVAHRRALDPDAEAWVGLLTRR